METLAADVVAILAQQFPNGNVLNASSRAKSLAKVLENLLLNEVLDFDEEEVLEHDEDIQCDPSFTLTDSEGSSDDEDDDDVQPKKFRFGGKEVETEKVREALVYFRSSESPSRPLTSMSSRFRWIKTDGHLDTLRRLEKRGIDKEPREVGLKMLNDLLLKWTEEKMGSGISLHDYHLRQQALKINKEHECLEQFKASHSWIQSFKKRNGFTSRKITKIVLRKVFLKADKVDEDATKCVDRVKEIIRRGKLPLTAVFNGDQSGFLKEMHGARTLACKGEKSVLRVVDSVSATTHSFTVLPLLSAGGTLYEKLYIVLQEPGGKLPKTPHFSADNLVVDAHTSHIMTKALMSKWVQNVVVPEMPKKMLLLVDSWSSFKDHDEIQRHVPKGKKLLIQNIPPGATGMIQPLDVYFFHPFKRFVRRITSYVQVNDFDFPVQKRDNLLKMVSQVYHQFKHPMFQEFLRYSWYKAGYTSKPAPFQTPCDYCFPVDMSLICELPGCNDCSFVRCSYCDKACCIDHFLVRYHRC